MFRRKETGIQLLPELRGEDGGKSMTFALYFLISIAVLFLSAKIGAGVPDDTTWIIIAILTAGEVIAHACEKR